MIFPAPTLIGFWAECMIVQASLVIQSLVQCIQISQWSFCRGTMSCGQSHAASNHQIDQVVMRNKMQLDPIKKYLGIAPNSPGQN